MIYTLELSSIMLSWIMILELPMVIIYVGWPVFTLQYTGYEKWVTRRNLALLSIVPVVMLFLTFTNEYHGLMWSDIRLIIAGKLVLLQPSHGAWFWVYVGYGQILLLSSGFLLIHRRISAPFYRRQITSLLVALIFSQLVSLLPLSGHSPLSFLFVTVLLSFVASPALALSIYRFRLADIIPVARETVIDGMSDGVMVLDAQNRVLDVNPIIQQLIGYPTSEVIGQPLEGVWPEWVDQIGGGNEIHVDKEITLNLEDEQHIYDVQTSPLTDWRDNIVSWVIVLRDITERKRAEILLNTRQKLQKETSLQRGLTIIADSMERLGFERFGVFLIDPKGEKLVFHSGKGDDLPRTGASIPLKKKKYFGVKCVLEKKTIYVKDLNSTRGKTLFKSNSFVWVPIVVQDETFAALAASTIKNKGVTDEEVKNLEVLADMCAAFIDRTRIEIEPVVEKTLKTEIKYRLDPKEGYLVLEKKPEKSFEIFFDLVTHAMSGFVVSREYPEKLKKKYNLQKTPMLWLSESETKDTINPNDLPKLSFIIEDFTRKSKESVVLLDGLEYLTTHTGFDTMLKYLHRLRDIIVLNNSRLIIPVNRETLSSKEFNMLEREFIILKREKNWKNRK